MKRLLLYMWLVLPILLHANKLENLNLKQALELVKNQNLEVSIASLDEKIKNLEYYEATGKHFGSLDLIQNIMRSNDASNVFGFALSSREASFRNFGFSDFLANQQNPNLLDIMPKDLNYPEARTFYQTKLQYTLPLFTGGKIINYKKIRKSLLAISSLDKQKILSEKVRQTKKAYSDIILLDEFVKNLNIILANIEKLELMSKNMLSEGYAKKIDVLEVQSKKANILRMLNQSKANKTLTLQLLSFLVNNEVISIDKTSFTKPKEFAVSKNDVKNTIDFKKANEGLKLSKSQINISRANFLPSAGLIAEYSSTDDKFLGNFREHDAYTIGIGLKWNLFNGGSDYSAYEKARVNNLKAKEQIKLAQKGIWLKISKLKTEIEKLEFDIQSIQAQLNLARDIYKNYLGRYQESLVSINDVLIKQSSELELVLKLKEVQNKKFNKIFILQSIVKRD